jgi:hypothetical protein
MATESASIPFFVHIPKAAGSTIRALITLNYESDKVLSVYGNFHQIVETLAANVANKDKFDLIQGHMPYGAHYQLNLPNPRYFVFLRDPVERMFSDIAYSIRSPYHGFHNDFAGGDKTPAQLLEIAKGIHYYRDNMTNYISGLYFTRKAELSDLHRAIDNLWKSELVGLSSAFEESLLIMAKLLGWKHVIAERLNTAHSKIEITDELRASANQVLTLDNALYAVAQDISKKQIDKYGSLLKESAEQLRDIYQSQKTIAPDREYEGHMVGDELKLHTQLNAMVAPTSPLGRWISEITPVRN